VLPSESQLQFFRMGKGSLGGVTPMRALRRGQTVAVVMAAEGYVGR